MGSWAEDHGDPAQESGGGEETLEEAWCCGCCGDEVENAATAVAAGAKVPAEIPGAEYAVETVEETHEEEINLSSIYMVVINRSGSIFTFISYSYSLSSES